MFPKPEMPQPDSKVVHLPFPEKAEDAREVHFAEIDKQFEQFLRPFFKMRAFNLTKFNFRSLREKIVKEGKISEEVFEKYLESRGFTFEKWWAENTID